MANIEKISGKNGDAYRITVAGGFDTTGRRIRHRTTYKPAPGMTARQTEKAVQRAAADFERSIEQGYAFDDRRTFAEYAAYWLDLKERTGTKHRTICGYRELLPRTNAAIGHIALQDIRAYHLNSFYKNLSEKESGEPPPGRSLKRISGCSCGRTAFPWQRRRKPQGWRNPP